MMKSGLVSATFKSLSVENVLKIARNAGLQAIEWSENHHIPCGDEAFASTVGKLTADAGLEIAGYGSYYRLGQGMDILPSLRTAKAIGAKQVRIWAGTKASAEVLPEERKALVKELGQVCAMAGDMGMVLNLEWHKNTLTDTNESGFSLLGEVNSPYLRTLWQPTQALSPEQREAGLKMILPFLSYFHVYYWDATGRRPLEEGKAQWEKYFSLPDENRDTYALLEFVKDDSEVQFYKDADVLKEMLDYGRSAH